MLDTYVLTISRNATFSFRNYYRIIVAGGGTGGMAVFFGEQLNHTNGEVIYIDFSSSSMKIAQQRTRYRDLRNIIWINSWIEGIRFFGIGAFETLECSGVLHHLKSPQNGLKVVNEAQTRQGEAEFMVYATFGRTGIYQIQELLSIINAKGEIVKRELKQPNI